MQVLSKENEETSQYKAFLCLHEEIHTVFRQMLTLIQKDPLKINVFLCLLTFFSIVCLISEMLIRAVN